MDTTSEQKKGSRFERARVARLAAVQAIFQIGYQRGNASKIIDEFVAHRLQDPEYPYPADQALFLKIMQAVQANQDEIQTLLTQNLKKDWAIERLDPVLAAILTAGIAELMQKDSKVAAPIIISEYVDVAKGFFQGQENGYVNKVLDQIAQHFGLPLKKK